ncbi:hypothetical protein AKJ18_10020 [Vibrio xuii]|nr:hypothetical protein AKJ18_10020 [Vibrio xuii]
MDSLAFSGVVSSDSMVSCNVSLLSLHVILVKSESAYSKRGCALDDREGDNAKAVLRSTALLTIKNFIED